MMLFAVVAAAGLAGLEIPPASDVPGQSLGKIVPSAADGPQPPDYPAVVHMPNRQDVARVYPNYARTRGINARVHMRCRVVSAGELADCTVALEEPNGFGFGAAALKLASEYKVAPVTKAGRPSAGVIMRIPILFRFTYTTAPQMEAYHPKLGVGRVSLDCRTTTHGTYDNCFVVSLAPADSELGDVALKLATRFTQNAHSGVRVVIPINFAPAPPAQEAPQALPEQSLDPTEVKWLQKPEARDIAREYPAAAARGNVAGLATVQCVVDGRGRLEPCKAVDEEPSSWGFGAAALRLSKLFAMPLTAADGTSVEGRPVTIRIRFVLPRR